MSIQDQIIRVTTTKEAAPPTAASFSYPLIASEFLAATPTIPYGASERVRSYASLAEVATEFTTASVIYYTAVAFFEQPTNVEKIYVGRKLTGADGTETWTAALTAILLENSEWYGLTATTRTLADQEEIADWIESNKRLYACSTGDANVVDSTGDIAEYVKTQGYERTYVAYNTGVGLLSTSTYPAEGMMGYFFTKAPGSYQWSDKTITGIPADLLTETQYNTAVSTPDGNGKNANVFINFKGVTVCRRGSVGNGEWIDIVRGVDWLDDLIQTKAYAKIYADSKVPYTDQGIQALVQEVKSGLQAGVTAGLLADIGTVSYPLEVDVSTTDKANRELKNITYTAPLAGAINKAVFTGTVTL